MTYSFVPGADWFAWLRTASTIEPNALSGNLGLAVFVLVCGSALACCVWALRERERWHALRGSADAEQARARTAMLLRDGLIGEGREAIVVWDLDSSERLSFADGAQLLDACLAGPDHVRLSIALARLRGNGAAFQLTARHDDTVVALRGSPVGRHAAVFLHPEPKPSHPQLDFRAVLEALPLPVWLRDNALRLCWANTAFLEATGAPALDDAIHANSAFDRSERDLAFAARDAAKPVEAKRFAIVQGARRPLSLWSHPLPDGTVVGAAYDLTPPRETGGKIRPDLEGYVHALNQLTLSVAIFGANRRLVFCNRSYRRLWGLDKDWLDTHPTEGEILDRLRELRRLPEQSDFAAWKRDRLKLFDSASQTGEELWHLPDGTALRVVTRPRPSGGLLYLFEGVSDRLRKESDHNELIQVQQAMLDMLREAVAVFGTDGRLRLHNAAFERLWQLGEEELSDAPHLKSIAEACAARFGRQATWNIISSSVTSSSPKKVRRSFDVERSDGTTISISLGRLPDGAALVTFTDITRQFRSKLVLRGTPTAAA